MNLIKKNACAVALKYNNVLSVLINTWSVWKIVGVTIYLFSFSSNMTWTNTCSLEYCADHFCSYENIVLKNNLQQDIGQKRIKLFEQDIYCKLFHHYFADNYHQLPRNNCFSISHFYRIYLKGLTGTAGKISSISQPGNDFSTKDADNDKCICKCSQMLTGGTNVFMFLSLPIFIGTEIVYEINSDNFDY